MFPSGTPGEIIGRGWRTPGPESVTGIDPYYMELRNQEYRNIGEFTNQLNEIWRDAQRDYYEFKRDYESGTLPLGTRKKLARGLEARQADRQELMDHYQGMIREAEQRRDEIERTIERHQNFERQHFGDWRLRLHSDIANEEEMMPFASND